MANSERNFGLDMTRCMAVVLVLSVHFFLNNGFYDEPLTGAGMAASTIARMGFMVCVPLFIMLTGYLRPTGDRSLRYYKKLLPVLMTYALCAAGCLAFRMLVLREPLEPGLLNMVRRVLNFTAAPYSWYVEMYIGLFLLTPFLSAGWNALDQRAKRSLLATLLILTALPPVCNVLGQVLPAWWTGVYPVTYFMLGAWLREHPVQTDSRVLILVWVSVAAAVGTGQYAVQQILYPGLPFRYSPASYWESLFVVVETVCAFSLFSRCQGKKFPGWLRWLVGRVSRLSLPIYLISYITDQLIYPPLRELIPTVGGRLPLLPLMVAASVILSGVMAQIVDIFKYLLLTPLRRRERERTRES